MICEEKDNLDKIIDALMTARAALHPIHLLTEPDIPTKEIYNDIEITLTTARQKVEHHAEGCPVCKRK